MKILVTGVGGLVGHAVARLARSQGHKVVGVDSNYRERWFGPEGRVYDRAKTLSKEGVEVSFRDYRDVLDLSHGMDAVVHCAGQPSHDFSCSNVFVDLQMNFVGTVELLEYLREYNRDALFVFTSTNKVYGDLVNQLDYAEHGKRFIITRKSRGVDPYSGVNEDLSLDRSLHTPFGVSKAAADLMVQEYHNCFGMNTVTFRCGCITGGGSPVELHGFLAYLVKCAVSGKPYTIYGYGGRQVRDNLHATDLASAILMWLRDPIANVYNMGGGAENSVSILEAIDILGNQGFKLDVKEGQPRLGDHRWWITDTARFERDYPEWSITKDVPEMIDEMARCELGSRDVAS